MRFSSIRFILAIIFLASLFIPNIRNVSANFSKANTQSILRRSSDTHFPTSLIVRTRARGLFGLAGRPSTQEITSAMNESAGTSTAKFIDDLGDGYQVYRFNTYLPTDHFYKVVSDLEAADGIVSVEEDTPIYPDLAPDDPDFGQMTWLQDQTTTPTVTVGIDAEHAWDITTGSPDLTIAVLDSGMQDHPDLAGRWTTGYDFVSSASLSGDGDGWDADPHDTSYQSAYPPGEAWHGLHVAGTIGAIGNNNVGVVGLNWKSPIEPVRVIANGGGYLSDAEAGLKWAAGMHVDGVPDNSHPAKVFNMSFGSSTACPPELQNIVDQIYAQGGILVAAAGNTDGDFTQNTPANCEHVISVVNITQFGDRGYMSSYGATATIGAPGMNILSTVYTGVNTLGQPAYGYYSGTSMAAPHITGAISLILSVDPALGTDDVIKILTATAKHYQSGSTCVTMGNVCGAGLVDVYQAVKMAQTYAQPTAHPTPTATAIPHSPFPYGRHIFLPVIKGD